MPSVPGETPAFTQSVAAKPHPVPDASEELCRFRCFGRTVSLSKGTLVYLAALLPAGYAIREAFGVPELTRRMLVHIDQMSAGCDCWFISAMYRSGALMLGNCALALPVALGAAAFGMCVEHLYDKYRHMPSADSSPTLTQVVVVDDSEAVNEK